MEAKIIYIDRHYFGIDKNGEVTYDIEKMDRRREVSLITWSSYDMLIREGYTIYIYKNPNREDGLWRPICADSFLKHGFVNRGYEMKN